MNRHKPEKKFSARQNFSCQQPPAPHSTKIISVMPPPAPALARRTAAGLQPDESNHQQHRHAGAENNPVQNILPPPAANFKRQAGQRQDKKFQCLQLVEWMPVFAHAGWLPEVLIAMRVRQQPQSPASHRRALCNLCAKTFPRAGFARGQPANYLQKQFSLLAHSLRRMPTATAAIFAVAENKRPRNHN